VVVGIGIKLALIFGRGRDRHRHSRRIWIRFLPGQAVDFRPGGVQRAQHVIERAVLHHQNDDVLQILDSRLALVEHCASGNRNGIYG
jgi:hypothetical protein